MLNWSSQEGKYSIYGGFFSTTLNKLKSAVTNYSKCMDHVMRFQVTVNVRGQSVCQTITANVCGFHISSNFTDCLPVGIAKKPNLYAIKNYVTVTATSYVYTDAKI